MIKNNYLVVYIKDCKAITVLLSVYLSLASTSPSPIIGMVGPDRIANLQYLKSSKYSPANLIQNILNRNRGTK